ncbi:MAG: hypothetical protein ACLPN5_20910 [Roseiarcus sp.]
MVRGVHQIVALGEAAAGHQHHGNGDSTVMDGGRGRRSSDRDLTDFEAEMRASGFWLDERGQPKRSLFCESPELGIAI